MSNGISSSNTSVSGFKHDLNALQKLTSYVPEVKKQLCLHTATLRVMLGANPSRTNLLLKQTSARTSTQQHKSVTQALAYKMAARHLPSALHSRPDSQQYLLSEAAKTYELCGNTKAALNCRQMVNRSSLRGGSSNSSSTAALSS
ncbi:SREBF2 [Bugula neritina]|uniref:SREBF2 n=1 Tax=Bugula neritina TaxID=10212 RepID=A0A7J7KQJ7_BUGNE|nr:SREBF2 [Bugula neritina]